MNGNYCKDAVLRAVKLNSFLESEGWVTVSDVASYLKCSRPCAKKWLDAVSFVLLVTEQVKYTGRRGRPATEYKLIQ